MNKLYLAIIALLAVATLLYTLEPSKQQNKDTIAYLNFLKQFNKPIPNGDELLYRSTLFA